MEIYILYGIFACLCIYAAYASFRIVTTSDERRRYRTRLINQVQEQRHKIQMKEMQLSLHTKFELLSSPIQLTVFRYQLLRWTILIIASYYYIVMPFIQFQPISMVHVAVIALILIMTTVDDKSYSIPHQFSNQLLIIKQRKKEKELFLLSDLIIAELQNLSADQKISAYSLVKECLPYFDHIDTTLMKYLHLWKDKPYQAKDLLAQEIGGEFSESLSNLLYKIDNSTRDEAIDYIKSNTLLLAHHDTEKSNQKVEKKDIFYSMFFHIVCLMIIAWMINVITSMFLSSL